MRILVAPTAFKGTFSPLRAAREIARALRPARSVLKPMADGGDGTAEVLRSALGGTWIRRRVRDPLGRPVAGRGLLLPDGDAVVEVASASGLALLSPAELDPLHADTRGTGELIGACLLLGASRVLLGVGGSATTDGGAGLAHALGVRFLDARGRSLAPRPAALVRVARVELAGAFPVVALADVTNPLLGRRGAAAVYGPQKGASASDVRVLSRALRALRDASGMSDAASTAGAGAAGGVGFGVVALLGGSIVPGGETVADLIGLDDAIASSDLVITGEGRLDAQTLRGKAPFVVAQHARALGVPCIAVVGSSGLSDRAARAAGFSQVVDFARFMRHEWSWSKSWSDHS